ncbi:MAG: carbohydrate-binding family 9-like protein [Myxococcales bacterium]
MRLLAVVLALCGGCARSGSHGPYVVHRARGPIAVDGVLLEPSWDRAERTGRFVRSIDGKPAAAATDARLLWDDDALYAAFQCEDKDVATPFTKNDESLYTSNVVEMFLNPSGDLARYVEIEVAPSNALFDASFTGRRAGMDLGWSSRALHAVHVDGTLNDSRDVDKGWTVELAIPFAALPGTPHPRRGDEWRFNLYRLRQPPGEGQALSPPMVGDFHALDKFATLRFED